MNLFACRRYLRAESTHSGNYMNINWWGLCRTMVIYIHLAAMVFAAISIAFLDCAIFQRGRFLFNVATGAARMVLVSLLMLWGSGLAMIAIDTGFNTEHLLASPKLLAKLCVVIALSVNGVLIHAYVLPQIQRRPKNLEGFLVVAPVLGAISMTSWCYAAFLGVAKNFTPYLGFTGFIALYFLVVAVGVAVALLYIRPRLRTMFVKRFSLVGSGGGY